MGTSFSKLTRDPQQEAINEALKRLMQRPRRHKGQPRVRLFAPPYPNLGRRAKAQRMYAEPLGSDPSVEFWTLHLHDVPAGPTAVGFGQEKRLQPLAEHRQDDWSQTVYLVRGVWKGHTVAVEEFHHALGAAYRFETILADLDAYLMGHEL